MAGMVSFCGVLVAVGCKDLELDGVSGVLPRSNSFNGKGFTFGEPP